MNKTKHLIGKNVLGLAILALGVIVLIGFVVSGDNADTDLATGKNNNSNFTETETVLTEDKSEAKQDVDDATLSTEPVDATENITSEEVETQVNPEEDAITDQESMDTNTFTLANIQTHASSSSCWTIVNDKVYDITDYIPQHPGGDEILRACGTDGTNLFETGITESGEQVKSRGGHSASAEVQLESFLLGNLE